MTKNLPQPLSPVLPSSCLYGVRKIYTTTQISILMASREENSEKITSAYELYHGALLRYCDSRVSSHEKAVDIVQDTYFRMWKYMFDGNLISHEKAFLYTTAKHLIVDEYRKKIAFSLDVLIDTREEPKITQSDDLYSVEEKLESIDCIKKYLKHTALYFT